jgi:hypothetical protein
MGQSACPNGHGNNPDGSKKFTGSFPAYAYRLIPPAIPIGSSLMKRPRYGSYHRARL